MRGDPGALYDAHAARLYAYCWSLVGDEAADAVADTFAATVQHPPRGDSVLWLYALSRSACIDRGALDRAFGMSADPDPLLRAASTLRADHREVLLLHAGEWLEVRDIARVLGIAPDTVRQLLNVARTRLERAVLDVLMRDTGPQSLDVIAAFEKGSLAQLLARRTPAQPPVWLRERALAAFEGEMTRPLTGIVAPNPVVVIGSDVAAVRQPRRKARSLTALAGVAASAAAAIGLLVSWPTSSKGGAASLVPTAGTSDATRTGGDRPASSPNQSATERPGLGSTAKGGTTGAGTPDQSPAPAAETGGGLARQDPSAPGSVTPPGSTATGDPSPPEDPPAPPDDETPTTPPEEPTDPPTTPPTTPPTEDPGDPTPTPTPTEPTETPTETTPSPSSNPVPTPGQD
ncbi:RNA polymerase sigma factor [Spirillospora sp. NPDC047279]|uniref:RNA polymerase sigma factor n=1 Tax=Spirillospora sp. NPDC047279 TaxID=3155478 RepID=UPI00340B29E5